MDVVGDQRGFRPDVEGLRAVAVIGVLAFHANIPLFTGGYIGVDVFFVISGFLITGLLLREITRTGRIGLADFYARRCRRLLPAVGVTIVATMIAGLLLMPPLRVRELAVDAFTAALSAANWRFISQQTDYLAESAEPSPLLHFWSLAVEEQFYLAWAPLLAGCVLLARLLRRNPIAIVAVAIITVTVASFVLSLWWTATSGPVAYLSTPTRAWQLGAGAIVALTIAYTHRLPTWSRHTLALGGAGAIIASTMVFNDATPFPGTAGLLPVLGAVAVIYAGAGANGWLTTKPMRWMGRLSFSWYLWHWPVVVLAQVHFGELSWPVLTVLVTAAAFPAWLTLHLVEQPLRRHPTVASRPARGLAVGATAMVVPLTAALLSGNAAIAAMEKDERHAPRLTDALAAPPQPDAVDSGPMRPAPHQAADDRPNAQGCQVGPDAVKNPDCLFGEDEGGGRIVLFGDSHAAQWLSPIRDIAESRGMEVEVLTKNGCPAADITVFNRQTEQEFTSCDTWRDNTIERINTGDEPELIVTTSINGRYTTDDDEWTNAWADTIDALDVDSPIAYLRDTPRPGEDIPTCLSGAGENWAQCEFDRDTSLPHDAFYDRVVTGEQDGDVHGVDLTQVLCTDQESCPAVIDGAMLYRDDSHLTDTAARLLGERMEHELQTSGLIANNGDSAAAPEPAGWSTQFRDDFDSGDIGDDDWTADVGAWSGNTTGSMTDSRDNVALDDGGNLAITPQSDGKAWTSGSLSTSGADITTPDGGVLRAETSIRLPDVPARDGDSYRPQFRMLTEPGEITAQPNPGDIGVVGQASGEPSIVGTVTGDDEFDSPQQDCQGCQQSFHTYTVEIDDASEQIRWYLNGNAYHQVDKDELGESGWQQVTDSAGYGLNIGVTVEGDADAVTDDQPLLVDHIAVYTKE